MTISDVKMTLEQFEDLVKRLTGEGLPPPQIIVVKTGEPELTPDVMARWVRQVAPLAEAEKVLKDWLETVGGINYVDGAMNLRWGYWAQSNREGFQGINLYPHSPEHPVKCWSTYAQLLEFALEYARQTIQIDEHAKGYKSAVMQMTEQLVAAGVPAEQIDTALVAMGEKLKAEINKPDAN